MRRPHQPPSPLDTAALERLAVNYVGRYATSRAKLAGYLQRKIGERGWDGPRADVDGLTQKLAALGYLDDRAFAEARGRSLTRRGYGARRVDQALKVAGIEMEDRAAAAPDRDATLTAATALARRRRIGPFASAPAERPEREKWFAALLRAGHAPSLARAIVALPPSDDPERAISCAFAHLCA